MLKRKNSAKASEDVSQGTSQDDGNTAKYAHTEDPKTNQKIICTLPPHHNPPTFSSPEEYELHYKKAHANRCTECLKNFPAEHYLNLHIAENHDPLIAARKAKGEKTFACFVEDCEKVCSTAQKRRMHLIDKHFFPKNYDFFIVNDGLKGRRSLLRPNLPKQASSKTAEKQGDSFADGQKSKNYAQTSDSEMRADGSANSSEDEATTTHHIVATDEDCDVQGITKSMSELKFVPNSVRFGRGRGRGGLARR